MKLAKSLYKALTLTPKHPGTTLPDTSTMFSYLEFSFRNSVINTLKTICQMDYEKIEHLHLDIQESRERNRKQKIELKEIRELISGSTLDLTSNHFQDKSSIPSDLRSKILASDNPAQIIQERLTELKTLETQPPNYISIDLFQLHALSYNLYGFYSAHIKVPENASSEFKKMRMIFKYNLGKKIEYFALLPSHEYNLFNAIVERANSLKEAYTFLGKYNRYCFNRAMKVEDKYTNLLKMCYKLKFSEDFVFYVIDQRELFLSFFEPMSSSN